MALRAIGLAGANLRHDPVAIDASRAATIFVQLQAEIPWQQDRLRLFGRDVDAPRLSCWIGDAGAVYGYSGARFEPLPWTPTLAALRSELEARVGVPFNAVLANLYRDGRDSMGWHSDDERELGPRPVIASLSFGATRRFRLRSRRDAQSPTLTIELAAGSLLVMAGATQQNYRHDLPKTTRAVGPRINLTFRQILVARR